ncbi:peptidoglycan/LPS O-acetylase OafA/YrhL [Rhodopirellula rubra]|uniref:Peptidoglycan/LPS O-acetylase OafA/YrhL n=1 Tax=Aporhodopirellula rubra TaxID=980271 RepID=A0A7W5H4D6_9BACT|nr:acyltransferase family protein [Aporhodopirellula rubra]MBB3206272.1 peptidoglycan/LPS O-acetylase OafA/YrhL [Aporhodopirellula rubra]
MSSSIPYRKDIDGLRAIAVLGVILYHFFPTRLTGGFVGVDVFFVISGYLITSILISDKEKDTLSLRTFWARRIRRIFPAALVVTCASMVAGYFWLEPASLTSLGKQVVAASCFAANFFMWRQSGDYWAPAAEAVPMLHMWSLAVEEQFYLVLPLLIWFLKLKWITRSLFILFVGSLGLSVYASLNHPVAAFYLTPSRSWELLAGALVACKATNSAGQLARLSTPWAGWLGLALIAGTYLGLNGQVYFPGPLAALPVIGACLVIISGIPQTKTNSLLSCAPMTYVGKLSYSLYLWHWPVLVFGRVCGFGIPFLLSFIPLSLITYHLVEQSTRKRANISTVLSASLAVLVVATMIGTGKLNGRTPEGYEAPQLSNYDCQSTFSDGGIVFNENAEPTIVLVGNSMAYQHGDLLRSAFPSCQMRFLTVGGTPARFLDQGEDGTDLIPPVTWTHQARLELDKKRRAILDQGADVVFVGDRWLGPNPAIANAETEAVYYEERQSTEAFIEYLATRSRLVVIALETPILDVPKEMSMQRIAENLITNPTEPLREDPDFAARFPIAKEFLREVASRFKNVILFDPSQAIRDGEKLVFVRDNRILFYNRSHLSVAATFTLREAITELISPYVGKLEEITHDAIKAPVTDD